MKRYLMAAAGALLVVITLLAGPVLAFEQATLVTLAGKYNMLAADIGMIGYDPANVEYLAQADETLESISDDMAAWIDSLPVEQRDSAAREWNDLTAQLRGDADYPGLLDGYDLNLDASQRVHYNALQEQLYRQPGMSEEALSSLQQLYLKISSAVAGYVALTSNPFGSMAMSMNDDDLRLVTLASDVDALFDELIKGSQDPMQQQQLRRLQSKWQFVRSTIIKASEAAMPYIVRYQGRQIMADLMPMISQ